MITVYRQPIPNGYHALVDAWGAQRLVVADNAKHVDAARHARENGFWLSRRAPEQVGGK